MIDRKERTKKYKEEGKRRNWVVWGLLAVFVLVLVLWGGFALISRVVPAVLQFAENNQVVSDAGTEVPDINEVVVGGVVQPELPEQAEPTAGSDTISPPPVAETAIEVQAEGPCNDDLIQGWRNSNSPSVMFELQTDYKFLSASSNSGVIDTGMDTYAIGPEGFVVISEIGFMISDVSWNPANEHFDVSGCALNGDGLSLLALSQQEQEKRYVLYIDSEGAMTEWDEQDLYEHVGLDVSDYVLDLIAAHEPICNGDLMPDWEEAGVEQFNLDLASLPGYTVLKGSGDVLTVNGIGLETGFVMVSESNLTLTNVGVINPATGNYNLSFCAIHGDVDVRLELQEIQDREEKGAAILVTDEGEFIYIE